MHMPVFHAAVCQNTKIQAADGETRTRNPPVFLPSALAIELTSSKAIAGKELSLSSWCIASLYIYHSSTVIDFSSEKYSGSTGHRNSWPGTRREFFSEDAKIRINP